jgi:hypothetical protein
MRAPIRFTYGNCVFADGISDAWAAFRLESSSYQWLGEDEKRARFLALLGALEALEADVQILRLAQEPRRERYSAALEDEVGAHARGEPHASLRRSYVREHIRRLAELGSTSPAVFVLVSLREPERDVASFLSQAIERKPGDWRRIVAEAFALGGAGFLKPATSSGFGFAPTRRTRGSPSSCLRGPPGASSCNGSSGGPSAADSESRTSTDCTSRER